MKKIISLYIILSILFAYDIPKDEYVTDYINQESSFNYKGDIYKLVAKGTLVHNDYYYDNHLTIKYDVQKNGIKLNSNNGNNSIEVSCHYISGGPFDNHYEIEIINDLKQPGWIIYSGGICAMTNFQYNAEIIFPDLDDDLFSSFNKIFRGKPIVKRNKNSINIYYDNQIWNSAGTACSILMPQKSTYNIKQNKFSDSPILLSDIDIIGYYGFRSMFMSGFTDLNPILMQYALDELYESEDSCMDWFFGTDYQQEKIDHKHGYLWISNTSPYRFQKIIDEVRDIKKIIKVLSK